MNDRDRYRRALLRQRDDRNLSPTPIPERITSALDICGLDGPEVDWACGVEEPAVDLWEAGDLVPTREQVKALAALTGFPVRFFYMPPNAKIGPVWMCGTGGCESVGDPLPEPASNVVPLFTPRGSA